jgi:hypothetical protein
MHADERAVPSTKMIGPLLHFRPCCTIARSRHDVSRLATRLTGNNCTSPKSQLDYSFGASSNPFLFPLFQYVNAPRNKNMGIPYSRQINAAFEQVTPLVAAGFKVLRTTRDISILLAVIQVLTVVLLGLILLGLVALLYCVNPDLEVRYNTDPPFKL